MPAAEEKCQPACHRYGREGETPRQRRTLIQFWPNAGPTSSTLTNIKPALGQRLVPAEVVSGLNPDSRFPDLSV